MRKHLVACLGVLGSGVGGVLGVEDGVGWRGRGALGVLESFPASRGVNHSQSTSPDQQLQSQ